jgi:hypothetical protein
MLFEPYKILIIIDGKLAGLKNHPAGRFHTKTKRAQFFALFAPLHLGVKPRQYWN